jgi:NifU-like protein
MMNPPLWLCYGKKLIARFEQPKYAGFFTQEEALSRQIRLVVGSQGTVAEGRHVSFYWLIDESDGVIVDAKFQAFGPPHLIAAADAASALLARKNYDQAKRLTAELIDKQLRDTSNQPAFSMEMARELNLIIDAIENGADKCSDIPFADTYVTSPVSTQDMAEHSGGYPGWEILSTSEKLAVIEEVIAVDIRPYVELDAGGVKVLNLLEDREVIIGYQGSCTTCHSATGSTLSAIQQILRAKVHANLVVTPDLTSL